MMSAISIIAIGAIQLFVACLAKNEIPKNTKAAIYPAVKTKASDWATYKDTLHTGVVLSFQYPKNLVAEGIQNGRCVGKPVSGPKNDITNSMMWCIWMQDASDYPIQHFIDTEKKTFKWPVTEKRETIRIGELEAIKVNLTDAKARRSREIIYIKSAGTLFEIIRNHGEQKEFERFYNSFRLTRME